MASRRRARAAALALAVCVLALGTAHGQPLPDRRFDIEPQPVAGALRSFAAQAQMQLIFSEQDVGPFQSHGVAGVLSPEVALRELLRGTGLEFEFTANNVVVVRRPAATVASTHGGRTGSPDAEESDLPAAEAGRAGEEEPGPAAGPGVTRDKASGLQLVVITGSRIVRRDLEAASPVVTVERQAFNESSTLAVESVLNQLPQFVPAGTQFVTGDIFPTATNTPGTSTLNLRGLGTNRTLVLIDGRRAQPANSTLVIDANSIPASAIESVEIISGGASAIYGADAMGGVTNFKLRKNFQGASLEARTGVTEAGDGEESRLSALFGASMGEGRGNVMLGVEWMKRAAAGIRGRPFFEQALTDTGAPATAVRLGYVAYEPNAEEGGLPSQEAADALFPERTHSVNRATSFFVNPDNTTLFKSEGALGYTGPFDEQFKMQPSGVLGRNNLDARVSSPLTRYSAFARAHYALADWVNAFAQANFVSMDVSSLSQPAGATGGFAASIPRDAEHPVPPELAALLDSRGENVLSEDEFDPETGKPIVLRGRDANWRLGRTLDFLPARSIHSATDLYQMLAGLDGTLPVRDWTWEAYISHGQTRTDSAYIGFASTERYRMIVEAPYYGRGFTQSGPGRTSITCTTGLPVFERFEVSQDCIDAIALNASDRTRLTQNVAEANLQGGVADLWAGELRAAVGASYRKNTFQFLPDAIRATNSIIDLPVGAFANANVRGATDVREIYGEILVPLLADKPFAHTLELELGARYSDYNTAGGVPTYKALFSWAPSENVRFRGGYQLANRAPNINELYLERSSVPVTLRGPDPCRADTLDVNGNHPSNPHRAQVQALCSQIIGTGTSTFDEDPDHFVGDGRTDGGEIEARSGNLDLKSETGETYTLGVVLTSPFEGLLRDVTIAIDYYRARITDAISQVSAQTTYDLCFNRDGVSNPTYSIDDPNGMCRNIVRDEATGNRRYVDSRFENLGLLETSGIDVQASWRASLAELGLPRVPGSLALSVSLNRLLEFRSQDFPTAEVLENAGTFARGGQFDYRALTTLRYQSGTASIALNWRRLPAIRSQAYVTDPNTPNPGTESYSVYNLSAGWRVTPAISLTAGIDNLFDRDPNRVGISPTNNGAGSTAAGYYDVLGRRYYGSIRIDF
ncbi:MAG: TonB-dependent receptor [Steroidobacteraceae bacterium]|nr:TonB-dependent receptor [Steroidobacteraceae bacterium]